MLTSKSDFFENQALPAAGACFFQVSGVEVGSKNRSKISVFLGIAPETPPRCPKTPPRRVCSKTPQDASRTIQDRPEVAPGRPQDVPKCPKTTPRWAQDARESAQDATRSEKKETQKRSKAQSPPHLVFGAILGVFWKVFGWIWDGCGRHFGVEMVPKYTNKHIDRKICGFLNCFWGAKWMRRLR